MSGIKRWLKEKIKARLEMVGGSAPLVMTDQNDFYSRLSAIHFSFKADEL